jgi:uncharacterized HhH-GPD family protein
MSADWALLAGCPTGLDPQPGAAFDPARSGTCDVVGTPVVGTARGERDRMLAEVPCGGYDPVMTTTDHLPYTGDPDADRLLVTEPMALLIGFVLDQQVPLQKAFFGPHELKRRIGTVDARTIAAMDPERLDAVFRERPALHRFPGNMARRTQELAAVIAERYGGDAARVWTEAKDARDLHQRLLALPGIGPMKAGTLVAILGKRLGVAPSGWEAFAPRHMTLGDVDSQEALARYQAGKRAFKAAQRAAAGDKS